MELTVGGRTINLRKALPWTAGDWEDLETETGISPTRLSERPSTKEIISIVHAVLKKADPAVTRNEVRTLELGGPEMRTVLDALNTQRVDVPFSTLSTPSPAPTDGPSET